MHSTFIGRENELADLNGMYMQHSFQMFVLYGRRRVGKTTLLNEFCKGKKHIFYSAEQSNDKLNLEKFSSLVFQYYHETNLEPFSSWTNALSYIDERQQEKRLVIVIDEFPYLVRKNRALLSELQHLIDHKLKNGNLFIVLCGSYMGFMEKEVLSLTQDVIDSWYSRSENDNIRYLNCFPNALFTWADAAKMGVIVAPDEERYMNCINDYRRYETAFEGLRFFDLKRWGIPYTHEVGHEGEKITLTWDDPRRAIEIPADVIAAGHEPSQLVNKADNRASNAASSAGFSVKLVGNE